MKKHLLKLLSISIVSLSSFSAFATTPGFIAGIQLRQSDTHYNAGNQSLTRANVDSKGFGGRLYFGYQYDSTFGIELGYSSFKNANFNSINGTTNSGQIKESAIDLTGKATLNFNNGFAGYAKLGLARVRPQASSTLTNVSSNVANSAKIHYLYGVGATYELAPKVGIDLAWTRIQHRESIQNADLLTAGLFYQFG